MPETPAPIINEVDILKQRIEGLRKQVDELNLTLKRNSVGFQQVLADKEMMITSLSAQLHELRVYVAQVKTEELAALERAMKVEPKIG